MVKRKCPKCKAEFDRKCHYDRHINKKFDCRLKNDNSIVINDEKNDKIFFSENLQKLAEISKNEKKYSKIFKNELIEPINHSIDINTNDINSCCYYCNKNYSSKYALTRHLKDNCKIKKDSDNEKENIFKLLLEKDKQHKEEVEELKKQNKLLLDRIDKLINLKEHQNPNSNSNSKSKSNKITNNSIINNNNSIINNNNSITNNNLQNNYIMVNFGKEDLSIIDERLFIDRIIKKP